MKKEYRVTFKVESDSPEDAVNKVAQRLNEGGEADQVELIFADGGAMAMEDQYKFRAALDANNICPVCGRDYNGHVQEDGIKFCTSEDCPSGARTRYAIGFQYVDDGAQFDTEAMLTPDERESARAVLDQLRRDGEILKPYIVEWQPAQPHENYAEMLKELRGTFDYLVGDEDGREVYPELAKLLGV